MHIKMMSARYEILQLTNQAMLKTGQVLVRLMADGLTLAPIETGFGGDLGCSYSITKLAQLLGLDVINSIYVFYALVVGFGFCVASIGLCCFAKTTISRVIAIIGSLALSYLSLTVGDEYVVSFCVVACVPLVLLSFERASFALLCIFLAVLGFFAAYCNFLRMHTGTFLVLITLFLVYKHSEDKFKKIVLLCFFSCGFSVEQYWISRIFADRDSYLRQHGYTQDLQKSAVKKHVFWHNIYAGLGFIENNKNLYYADACSAEKVASIDNSIVYTSPAYEAVLRQEVFKLLYTSPNYVFRCMFAKLGVVLYYALVCFLPFFWAFYLYGNCMPLQVHIVYWIAMTWGIIPGLLTIPNVLYLFGFIVSALVYGMHLLVYVINKHSIYDCLVSILHSIKNKVVKK